MTFTPAVFSAKKYGALFQVCRHPDVPAKGHPQDLCDEETNRQTGTLPEADEERHGWDHGEFDEDPASQD